jgi:predicted Fe-Mo cluster-binding NifX family protein
MKICVTSVGRDFSSQVDPRFGRAAHFLIIDTETNQLHGLDRVTAASQGAGVLVAQHVIDAGAAAVVTGRIGPKAFDVLAAAGIEVYLAPSATVGGAVRDLTEGRLEKVSGPTAPKHAGMRA